MQNLKIIHVYGHVALLDWQDSQKGVKYAPELSESLLQRLSSNIRTVHEEPPDPQLGQVQDIIKKAERIIFLGFGYAKENMELLHIPDIIHATTFVHGTALGLEQKQIQDIRQAFITGTRPDPICGKNQERFKSIENLDCLALLKKYL